MTGDTSLDDAFRRFGGAADDVVEGALLVNRLIDPDVDTESVHAKLDLLAAGIRGASGAVELVAGLRAAGYAGTGGALARRDSSALNATLETRTGLPITLAVVLIGVAERLGFNAAGVNFPGHFLATVDSTLVDPLAMQCTDRAQYQQWLQQNDIEPEQAFRQATPLDIVLRMLNNLRMLAVAERNFVWALEISDHQLILVPGAFGLHIDRAELWSALGSPHMVKQELEQARELAPPATRSRIDARIRELGDAEGTLN